MLWLSWRQQRFEAGLACVALAVCAVLLLATHQQIVSTLDQLGIPNCLLGRGGTVACPSMFQAAKDNMSSELTVVGWLSYLPILIGVFLAASIALEMEQGTYRLTWTQSITRTRWTRDRLIVPIVIGLVVVGVIAVLGSWLMRPVNQVESPLQPGSFDVQGILPLAYMLLAFAITTTAGVTLRRALPALGTAVVAAFGLHAVVQTWLRPRLISPITQAWISGPPPYTRRDWLTQGGPHASSYTYIDQAGHHLTLAQTQSLCGQTPTSAAKHAWQTCLQTRHIGELIQFQPPSRFWPIQSIETALVAGTAVALLALTRWWLRNKTY